MLDETLGQAVFDRAIRGCVAMPRDKPAGYHQLITALSDVAGRNTTPFVMPWLAGRYISVLDAGVQGSQIVVMLTQPDVAFTDLPVDLALTTASGAIVVRTIHITGRSHTIGISGLLRMTAVHPDQEHKLLTQRSFGEVVHFVLRALDAQSVALTGNFTLKPVPATRSGDTWTLNRPPGRGPLPLGLDCRQRTTNRAVEWPSSLRRPVRPALNLFDCALSALRRWKLQSLDAQVSGKNKGSASFGGPSHDGLLFKVAANVRNSTPRRRKGGMGAAS